MSDKVKGLLVKIDEFDKETGFYRGFIKTSRGDLFYNSGIMHDVEKWIMKRLTVIGDKEGGKIRSKIVYPSQKTSLVKHLEDVFDGSTFPLLNKKALNKLNQAYGENWKKELLKDPKKAIKESGVEREDAATRSFLYFLKQKETYSVLRNYGLSNKQAMNAINQIGDSSAKLINSNPYKLNSIKGIDITTIEKIADSIGIRKDSTKRINAYINIAINNISNQGSTVFYEDKISKYASKISSIPEMQIKEHLNTTPLRQYEMVFDEKGRKGVTKSSNINTAKSIAGNIKRILREIPNHETTIPPKLNLNSNQDKAIKTSLRNGLSIITGGPGTGKSTIVNEIQKNIKQKESGNIVFCAPSGKAARRLEETTGEKALTIHSALGLSPDLTTKSRSQSPIEKASTIIIDEASMAGEEIMSRLLEKTPDHTRVVLIGDADQLPSVDAGQFLNDLIKSSRIPTTKLTESIRFSNEDDIAPAATAIKNKAIPNLGNNLESSFVWIDAKNDEEIRSKIRWLCNDYISKTKGDNLRDTTQILCPQHNTGVGTFSLNKTLVDVFNEQREKRKSVNILSMKFHEGDKVLQMNKNDYDIGLFNGDSGFISNIDYKERQISLKMENSTIKIPFAKAKDLNLANAITVHKSQGSEYKNVVIPVSKSNEGMLDWQILYTAITRGKGKVVLIGDRNTLQKSVSKDAKNNRETMLSKVISEKVPEIKNQKEDNDLNKESSINTEKNLKKDKTPSP